MSAFKLVGALLLALFVSHPASADTARTETRIVVAYSESADLFSLMDNTSDWWAGFTNPSYRKEWEERFGWSETDQLWANRYAEFRRRTFSDPSQGTTIETSRHGLFASRETNAADSDPLAAYMIDAPDIRSALRGLERHFGARDARMLRGFYNHFRPKWQVLLAESGGFHGHAKSLDRRMRSAANDPFIQRVGEFYQVDVAGEFRVFFTRFPPGNATSAEVLAGNTLLLHSPPDLPEEKGDWDSIVIHELVHYISARQPDALKRSMTDRFLARCKLPKGAGRNWMIEEPLAVAVGQAAYSQMVLGKPLDRRTNWYAVPWVDLTARTLEASVLSAMMSDVALADTEIVEEAADRCLDLTALMAAES